MVEWLKTKEGYIRSDKIVQVYTSPYVPKAVFLRLESGDAVRFNDFKDEEAALDAVEKIVDHLDELDC